ncbi:DUF2254 domain-containing protein [Gephyromycinifex aptenodytis]|uniref:DUF2254 domain-containing protein n=1 Tax=Gephyromycinifex aptenodytis TaxID=2716227 RepID=UPI001D004D66|nr:DUF2254 domain-containing protein [Gephyromycinifex aptenodytis]
MNPRETSTRAGGRTPKVEGSSWWTKMWMPFWAIPVASVVAAVAAGIIIPWLESWLTPTIPYVFQGGPEGARGLLGTIATGMISMTGLVFSITMVTLQLASSQFTPRVLGSFLDSRITQATLGVFTASFVFALTVTRSVMGDFGDTATFVPQLSVTIAFVLVLCSVGCFLAFIHHITNSIQVCEVISGIGDHTLALADKMYPETADGSSIAGPTWSPPPDTPRVEVSTSKRHGQITYIDYDRLTGFAKERDIVITVDRPVGMFLAEGQKLMRLWGISELDQDEQEKLYGFIGLGAERQMWQDVAFGIRQLVDIAERALSPGINDPTTAVQCINELHRVLRCLVGRTTPSSFIADEDGNVRVVHPPQSIEDLIDLAVAEINHYGKGSLQVPRRLRVMLDDLEDVSLQRYLPAIRRVRQDVDGPLESVG